MLQHLNRLLFSAVKKLTDLRTRLKWALLVILQGFKLTNALWFSRKHAWYIPDLCVHRLHISHSPCLLFLVSTAKIWLTYPPLDHRKVQEHAWGTMSTKNHVFHQNQQALVSLSSLSQSFLFLCLLIGHFQISFTSGQFVFLFPVCQKNPD